MKPLFHEDTKGRSNERNDEAKKPQGVHLGRESGRSEWWRSWDGGIDEVPVESQSSQLDGDLAEDLDGHILRLLLEVLVGFNYERRDYG